MSDITLNQEQKLYVIPTGGGYSCLGFDVAFKQATAIAEAIAAKRPDLAEQALDQKPDTADWGTMSVYNGYRNLTGMLSREKIDLGTWYDPDTHPEVKRQLELARNGRYRIRLEYGDAETGQAWSDRPEAGTVSRSMGPIKVPILVRKSSSHGGGQISSGAIVRISETPGNRVLWQHPTYTPAASFEATPAA
ncbi:hypothetical protein G6L37_01550 [Agrobacterium rubi]|nr:hypothetical protein [Agrobacterium rubi]NTF24078.1 hypothetical protein [Agrobacterium rubi]